MRVIFAGGGTGGHLFPGIALAKEFQRREDCQIVFVGAGTRLERELLPRYGYPLRSIRCGGLTGVGLGRKAVNLLLVPWAAYQSAKIIKGFAPDLVIGLGGYASGPVVAAAWALKYPTVIAEQNLLPGLTNRLLGRIAEAVFVAFPETAAAFKPGKAIVTGNPIRAEIAEMADRKEGRGKFTILVLGGSQGASSINQAMVDALGPLGAIGQYLTIIHQTGAGDTERVAAAYQEHGFEGRAIPFIEKMDEAYGNADLIIARAGATTIAEICSAGRASILIPFPYAAGDHQVVNARYLEQAGAARVIEPGGLTGARLAKEVFELYAEPGRLGRMAAAARGLARPDAARTITDHCLKLLGRQ